MMKKARGEARGYPRTAKFGPEIGGSLLAKKIVMGINKEKKGWMEQKIAAVCPKTSESEQRKIA